HSCFFVCYLRLRHLHSFPTRRSSDLVRVCRVVTLMIGVREPEAGAVAERGLELEPRVDEPLPRGETTLRRPQCVRRLLPVGAPLDRKSTRLNSSHVAISYAVFCLKKK